MSVRAARRRALAVAITAVGAAALAGCGSSGGQRSSAAPASGSGNTATVHAGRLSIAPAHAQPTSRIRFVFTAPAPSGVRHGMRTAYSLSATGPAGRGCVGVHEAGAPPVGANARATITVGPAQLGKQWCAGRYTARVLELQSAACKPSVPCPQYVRVVATVARGAFTVARG